MRKKERTIINNRNKIVNELFINNQAVYTVWYSLEYFKLKEIPSFRT